MSIIKVLGKMPDPFMRPDGTRVTPAVWPAYKKKPARLCCKA